MRVSRPQPAALIGLLAVAGLALIGCSATGTGAVTTPTPTPTAVHPQVITQDGARVIPDLVYGHAAGDALLLDACLPAAPAPGSTANPAPLASVILIHGGSWTRGDKADTGYREVCEWLARNGYPTFSVDYRMDPEYHFPAALDDVRTAVAWVRASPQRSRFDLDPARIAAFGGSAGGNLASLLGTVGTGPLTRGTRVAAVVDLSGPADLTGADTTPAFLPVQLAFLGCSSEDACPAARAASPIFAVSHDDPPFFIANSTNERIPIAQSRRFADALRAVGVPATFTPVPGAAHSIAMLGPELRRSILAFYASTVGANGSDSESDSSDGGTAAPGAG